MLYKNTVRTFITLLFFSNVIYAQSNRDSAINAVTVFEIGQPIPADAVKLGSVKSIDNGFKLNCGYRQTIDEAKEKAYDIGGNIMKITKLKHPDGFSSCYRLWADVYTVKPESINAANAQMHETIHNLLPDTAQYALLYIYRTPAFVGSAINYNVHLGDTILCRIKNDSRFIIKIYKEGHTNIWAKTEAKVTRNIDMQFGKAYFLKCSVKMGVFVGQPELYLIDAQQGYQEYQSIENPENLIDTKPVRDNIY